MEKINEYLMKWAQDNNVDLDKVDEIICPSRNSNKSIIVKYKKEKITTHELVLRLCELARNQHYKEIRPIDYFFTIENDLLVIVNNDKSRIYFEYRLYLKRWDVELDKTTKIYKSDWED